MGNPKVSVVILTTGKAEKVLECLSKQTFWDFELLFASEKGIVTAMNNALARAKGDIFIRLDDDLDIPPHWLEELIKPFSDPMVAGVSGPTFVPQELRGNRDSIRWAENPKGILKWLYDGNEFNPGGIRDCGCVSYDSNYEERFKSEDWFECERIESTNGALRTNLIRKVGGFDPKFDGVCEWVEEDQQFKIKKMGYKFIYNPKAYLYHLLGKGEHYGERFDGIGRIKNFIRFHWRHGRWRFLNIKFYVYLIIWTGYFVWKGVKK